MERQHQILLSNVIACRLKIGGEEMANKAVEEAQQVRVACWLLISSVEPLQCDFAVHDMCLCDGAVMSLGCDSVFDSRLLFME